MAALNWRPDLYRHHKCENCGTQAATVGTLCAVCDHERWEQQRNGNGTQPATATAPVVQWMGGKNGQYVQTGGEPLPQYVQLADWQAEQDAADLRDTQRMAV